MDLNISEKLIRFLVVALMNSRLYFTTHKRVTEAAKGASEILVPYLALKPKLMIGIKDDLLIFENKVLYDLSIFAVRLIQTITGKGAHGITFTRGVTPEKISALFEALLDQSLDSTEKMNTRLWEKGVDCIHLNATEVVLTEAAEGSAGNAPSTRVNDQRESRDIYKGALCSLQSVMEDIHRERKISLNSVNHYAKQFATKLRDHHDSFLTLTTIKDYDEYTFNHSVNVCIFATTLATHLGMNRHEAEKIAQAGLLHDVGKLLIDDEILYKRGRLTDEEHDIMKKHTELGAKILMEADGIHELSINVAFGHHAWYNGRGYPDFIEPFALDPVTELIHVLDVYEALTALRPYKEPFPPEKAMIILLEGAGSEFNPLCVEAFFDYYGVYMPGTSVRLYTEETAEVESSRPNMPFNPLLRLTHDEEGEPIVDEIIVDTAVEKHRRIISSVM